MTINPIDEFDLNYFYNLCLNYLKFSQLLKKSIGDAACFIRYKDSPLSTLFKSLEMENSKKVMTPNKLKNNIPTDINRDKRLISRADRHSAGS